MKSEVTSRLFRQLNKYLLDPIEECLARNSDGTLCIETKSPLDLEESISLPRGNIFHKDLSFPFREDGTVESWGVETNHPNIFLCGAGAIRGGGVSGISGHNAAMAVIEATRVFSRLDSRCETDKTDSKCPLSPPGRTRMKQLNPNPEI